MELLINKDFRYNLRYFYRIMVAFLLVIMAGCATAPRKKITDVPTVGIASWYGKKFHGRTTASGEKYDMHKLTAAHPELPFGTRVKVTHLGNNRSVIVRINDRGPFVKNRIIDLSYKAARELGMIQEGIARVRLDILD